VQQGLLPAKAKTRRRSEMQPIQNIRNGLSGIPECLTNLPPEPAYRGIGPGTLVSSIWTPGEPNSLLSHNPQLDFESAETESEASPEFDPLIEIGADVDETFPSLNGEAGERIRQSVMLYGMDALGYYVSFHVTGVQWGAYVTASGIAYLVRSAFSSLDAPLMTKAQLAFHAILHHELFHFAVDYTVAQSELTHQNAWWLPAKTVFRRATPNYCVIEEKLANAYMLRAFRTMKPALRHRGKQEALRDFTKRLPAGYKDGWQVRRLDWERELKTLAWAYGEHSICKGHPALWNHSLGYDWSGQFPIQPHIDWRHCPIHFVDDSHRLEIPPGWLSILSRLSVIQETDAFRKRLENMSNIIQKAWDRTTIKLKTHITPNMDFKPWPREGPNIYSVRVNENIRAHLKRAINWDTWEAINIGTHKEMGHG
jgi:hypothetical protein